MVDFETIDRTYIDRRKVNNSKARTSHKKEKNLPRLSHIARRDLCGGGVPSSHPFLGWPCAFFLSLLHAESSMKALLVLISTACAASALQLQARPPAPRTRLRVLAAPRLAESAEPESTPATPEPLTISDEQIAAAARAASEPGADPFAGFECAPRGV